MSVCGNAEEGGGERGGGGLDESIEEGARLEESCHSPEIGSRDEKIKYRGTGREDKEPEGAEESLIIIAFILTDR